MVELLHSLFNDIALCDMDPAAKCIAAVNIKPLFMRLFYLHKCIAY
jgi:hypothetical protein